MAHRLRGAPCHYRPELGLSLGTDWLVRSFLNMETSVPFQRSEVRLLRDLRLENLPHIPGDDFLALGGWVDAVGLVELFDSADAFE